MNKNLSITILAFTIFVGGYFYLFPRQVFDFSDRSSGEKILGGIVNEALAAQFDYLSKNSNSSCSGSFKDSSEQVEGLKKFKSVADQNIAEIPDDPYDIEAGLAKKLMSYYDMELMSEEQKAYDYAMQNSSEKGPCCCKCWRWYVYGGLGKYLIRNHGFTGEQVTQVWNLSDGCGGDSEHHH